MPIKINGATSGSTTITAPDTGGDESIELSTALASKLPYSYGTATPSTTDSGFLWYDSNSTPPVPKYWNGSSFATLAPAPGLELVTTETFSAVSSLSINSCFSSTYANYWIVITGVASANTDLAMRYRASGTDETGLVYARGSLFTSTGSTAFNSGSNSSTVAILGNIYTTGRMNITANIFAPNTSSTETNLHFQSVANTYFAGWTRCTATTQFDGLTIFPNSGNITGTIRVYGYKD